MKTNKKFKDMYYETPMFLGYLFLTVLLLLVLIYLFKKPLVAPVSEIPQANAQETISCEDPKGYLECQVYKGIIDWIDFNKISRIIECESKWNPNAIHVNRNGSIDRGLGQINTIHKSLTNEDAFNFKKNIDFIIKIYKSQGVNPWVCARILKIK